MNLNELKKKLIAALPPAIRERLGASVEDDEDELDVDEVTGEHEIDPSATQAQGEEDEDEEEDEEIDDEEARKKSIRSQIIRGAAVLGLAYYVATEYILVEEIPPEPPPVVKATAAPIQTPAVEATPEMADTQSAQNEPEFEMEEEAPAEPVVEIPPETPSEVLGASPQEVEEPAEEDFFDVAAEATAAPQEPPTDTFLGQTGESEVPPTPAAAASPQDTSEQTSSGGLDALIEAVSESDKRAREEAQNTNLNRTDPSYVKPPNYLRAGRGLVYNCIEGHWACVDKFSYFTCFENQNWNKDNGQKPECVTRDVYASLKDCGAVQKFYVNKPEPTDFCHNGEDQETQDSNAMEDMSNLLAP